MLIFSVPDQPAKSPWPVEVADDSLHTVQTSKIVNFDGDGRDDVLPASREGVFLLKRSADNKWSKTKLGAGNQEAKPFKGASEIKLGRLTDGGRYIATY